MQDLEKEKKCVNCKYFKQLYMKKGINEITVNCGICLKMRSSNNTMKYNYICKQWEEEVFRAKNLNL